MSSDASKIYRQTSDASGVVTDSCGCVFCDLDLPTYQDKDGYGRMAHWHHTSDGDVRCKLKS